MSFNFKSWSNLVLIVWAKNQLYYQSSASKSTPNCHEHFFQHQHQQQESVSELVTRWQGKPMIGLGSDKKEMWLNILFLHPLKGETSRSHEMFRKVPRIDVLFVARQHLRQANSSCCWEYSAHLCSKDLFPTRLAFECFGFHLDFEIKMALQLNDDGEEDDWLWEEGGCGLWDTLARSDIRQGAHPPRS